MRPAVCVLVAALLLAAPAAAAAQQEPVIPDTSAFLPPAGTPSPRGAMIRSFIFPGWGQASAHSYFRGGVYFAFQTGAWFMLAKTLANLSAAREMQDRRRVIAKDSILLAAEGDPALAQQVKNPFKLQQLVDSSETVLPVARVVQSRLRQRQDWITQVVFWTLVDAVDAYVTTQLADFPGHISAGRGSRGGLELRYTIPVGRHP